MYSSEIIRVVNTATNVTKYYVIICDQRKQITRQAYDRRYDSANGVSCLFTKSRLYKGVTYYHHYTTVTYETLKDIQL